MQNDVASKSNMVSPGAKRVRLDFLDGLRGLAALYVVLHHAYVEVNYRYDGTGLTSKTMFFTNWLLYGHASVAIFIVLSGYCLMLPLAQSADGQLRGGFRQYIVRRARRILPPYYFALGLFLLVITALSHVPHPYDPRWEVSRYDFGPGVLLSHLFLIHNLRDVWIFRIDNPMWSVATEWQIYFVFPLLLLPIWRRFGIVAAVIVAFVVGYAPLHLLPVVDVRASFWYLGLFALGMAGAVIGFSDRPRLQMWRQKAPWGVLALLFTALSIWKLQMDWTDNWNSDPLLGLAAFALIVYSARKMQTAGSTAPSAPILRILSSSYAVTLGIFSYSLYLVHYPILALTHMAIMNRGLSPDQQLGLLFGVGVPLALAVSYLFHLSFERRFMPGHVHTKQDTIRAAIEAPAP